MSSESSLELLQSQAVPTGPVVHPSDSVVEMEGIIENATNANHSKSEQENQNDLEETLHMTPTKPSSREDEEEPNEEIRLSAECLSSDNETDEENLISSANALSLSQAGGEEMEKSSGDNANGNKVDSRELTLTASQQNEYQFWSELLQEKVLTPYISTEEIVKGWQRRPIGTISQRLQPIIFQLLDMDVAESKEVVRPYSPSEPGVHPIITMYGIDLDGHSICVHVHKSYSAVVICTPGDFKTCNLQHLLFEMNARLPPPLQDFKPIQKLELLNRWDLCDAGCKKNVVEVRLSRYSFRYPLQQLLNDKPILIPGVNKDMPFHYKIIAGLQQDYMTAFAVSKKMKGCTWLRISPREYRVRDMRLVDLPSKSALSNVPVKSWCQIEVDTSADKITVFHPKLDTFLIICDGFRLLNFDIVLGKIPNEKSSTEKGQTIIAITSIISNVNDDYDRMPFAKVIHVVGLHTSETVQGQIIVFHSDSEKEMLLKWMHFVRMYADPDIMASFDFRQHVMKHILLRSKELDILKDLFNIGRHKCYEDAAVKTLEDMAQNLNTFELEGRVILDLLSLLQTNKENKEGYITLRQACEKYGITSNEQDMMDNSELSELFHNGNDDDKVRVLSFSLTNTEKTLQLIKRIHVITEYFQMAKISPMTVKTVIRAKPESMVKAMMLTEADLNSTIIPDSPPDMSDPRCNFIDSSTDSEPVQKKLKFYHRKPVPTFRKAEELNAIPGLYKRPIAWLEFDKIELSTLMSFNMCYGTMFSSKIESEEKAFDFEIENGVRITPFICQSGDRILFRNRETPIGIFKQDATSVRKGIVSSLIATLVDEMDDLYKSNNSEMVKENPSSYILSDLKTRIELINVQIQNVVAAFTGDLSVKGLPDKGCPLVKDVIASLLPHVPKNAEELICNARFHQPYGNEKNKRPIIVCYESDTNNNCLLIDFHKDDVINVGILAKSAANHVSKSQFGARVRVKGFLDPVLILKDNTFVARKLEPTGNETIFSPLLEKRLSQNPPLVRIAYRNCFEILYSKKDVNLCMEQAMKELSNLVHGNFSMKDFIIIAATRQDAVSDAPKTANELPLHEQVSNKMNKRTKGNGPKIGDRIPYVLVKLKNTTTVDHPLYVIEENFDLDYDAYQWRYLLPMLKAFFDPIIGTRVEACLFPQRPKERIKKVQLAQFHEETKNYLIEKGAYMGGYIDDDN